MYSLQVTDLETKLSAANAAGAAAVNAKGSFEEVSKQSRHEMAALRAEIAALRTRHEAELHEAQQALQRERAQLQATFEVRHAPKFAQGHVHMCVRHVLDAAELEFGREILWKLSACT